MAQKTYRWAVVGSCGVIGKTHVAGIGLNAPRAHLAAVCDASPSVVEQGATLKVPAYTDLARMLAEVRPDVVTIGTPHPLHVQQAVAALKAGCHVLCEKPLAAEIALAERMVAAASKARRKLGVCFQARESELHRKVKQMLADGEFGRLQRVHMEGSFFKTMKYYNSASWRGTWGGEGGGVLMNQAPHDLDLFTSLFGLPSRVTAVARTGFHRVSVEDTADAICEFKQGFVATLHFDVNDAPATWRLHIYGSKQSLLRDQVRATTGAVVQTNLARHVENTLESIATYNGPNHFHMVHSELTPIELSVKVGEQHSGLVRNFCDALDGSADLLCDGRSGLRQLELANAIMLSSYTGRPVDLPVDRKAVARMFSQLAKAEMKARFAVAARPPKLAVARKAKGKKKS